MIPKSTILLIEDEENIRSFIATTLKNQNYKIITASSGTEGLHLCASLCPDLVLLDLGLPDMDGMTVIKKLREWNSTPHHCHLRKKPRAGKGKGPGRRCRRLYHQALWHR